MVITDPSCNLNYYIGVISDYFRRNIELNIKIVQSLECLVFLHPRMSVPFKTSLTEILSQKYKCVDLAKEMEKIKAMNTSLLEPFFCLVGQLAKWNLLEV